MVESRPAAQFFSCHAPLFLLLFYFLHSNATAQSQDSVTINKKRLTTLVVGASASYGATLVALNYLWYQNTERQSFQFFNDNAEWKQADKLGHFYSSFYFSYGTSQALLWCNVPVKKADLTGALTGFLIMMPVEIMDGFSEAYGASVGDLLANAAGSSFFLGQKRLWNEVRILPKYSFHRTSFAGVRPAVLGENTINEFFKDYNGQTQWLSVDMDKFMSFPRWLNVAAGYGAQDMLFARDNENRLAGYDAYRQYYLSIDFDLTSIRTHSKVLKTLIFFGSMIKIPAPAMEFSRKGIRLRALYF